MAGAKVERRHRAGRPALRLYYRADIEARRRRRAHLGRVRGLGQGAARPLPRWRRPSARLAGRRSRGAPQRRVGARIALDAQRYTVAHRQRDLPAGAGARAGRAGRPRRALRRRRFYRPHPRRNGHRLRPRNRARHGGGRDPRPQPRRPAAARSRARRRRRRYAAANESPGRRAPRLSGGTCNSAGTHPRLPPRRPARSARAAALSLAAGSRIAARGANALQRRPRPAARPAVDGGRPIV